MENSENYINKPKDISLEGKKNNLLLKYLEIIKSFENIQPPENNEFWHGFKADVSSGEDYMRLFRTSEKQGDGIVVSDVLQDASSMEDCMIRYLIKKDENKNIEATFKDASGGFAEKLPPLVKKLETLVRKNGSKISFSPGKTFEFDGLMWKEIEA